MTFAERIKQIRLDRGFSIKQMAKFGEMRPDNYILYEKGDSQPRNSTLCKFADALNVSTDFLLGRAKHCQDIVPIESNVVEVKNQNLYKSERGFLCTEKHCEWRIDCGDGKFYCPGAGCMKAREEMRNEK